MSPTAEVVIREMAVDRVTWVANIEGMEWCPNRRPFMTIGQAERNVRGWLARLGAKFTIRVERMDKT